MRQISCGHVERVCVFSLEIKTNNDCESSNAPGLRAGTIQGVDARDVTGYLCLCLEFQAMGELDNSEVICIFSGIKNIRAQDFETEVLKATTPVLVDFYTEDCAPCRSASPIIQEIEAERAGALKAVKIVTTSRTSGVLSTLTCIGISPIVFTMLFEPVVVMMAAAVLAATLRHGHFQSIHKLPSPEAE